MRAAILRPRHQAISKAMSTTFSTVNGRRTTVFENFSFHSSVAFESKYVTT